MSKNNVKEPFVRMYELKGLKSDEANFICKVWSFQSNGQRCYMSNRAWAEYLGCSPTTIGRIKRKLKTLRIIDTDGVFVRLKMDIEALIAILNKEYQPKYKPQEKIPFWEKEADTQIDHDPGQNEHPPSHIDQPQIQVDEVSVQAESDQDQVDSKLYNELKKYYNRDNNKTLPSNWDPSFFCNLNVTSTNQIDISSDKITKRNQLLSFWYRYISEQEILQHSLNYFNNENILNLVFRILCRAEEGKINLDYMVGVNINHFLLFTNFFYNEHLKEIAEGSDPNLREVANNLHQIILEEGSNFKLFITPNTINKNEN
jgi:hypothetical protein